MTVAELMTTVDTLHPNQFSTSDKLKWLNQVEQTIWHEIILTHETDMADAEMPVYADAAADTALLAEDPYSRLYPPWMDAQISYYNRESSKYADASTAFNSAYTAFQAWYNRTHMPTGAVNHLHLVDRGW